MAYAGQMLVPLYLVTVCHLSTEQTGWMLAPIGIGMLCSYPLMGSLTEKYGCRWVSASGACLALTGTLPLIWMAQHTMTTPLLCSSLFIRGIGMGAINIPSMAAAYASISKERLAIATTALNIVQRLGGPMATTVAAMFLEWATIHRQSYGVSPFAAAFLLLAIIHGLGFFSSLRLPVIMDH